MRKVFLGVYTCKAKAYCDEEFFKRILSFNPMPSQIYIIDNTLNDKGEYTERIKQLMAGSSVPYEVLHIEVEPEEKKSYPNRVICESANKIRNKFLESDAEGLFILESDVVPIADNCIELLLEHIEEFAIIGGIYYKNFHKKELFETDQIIPLANIGEQISLSGCTLYRRDLVEKIPFRWGQLPSGNVLPDACYSLDTDRFTDPKYNRANYGKIQCKHLHKVNGSRGWEEIWEALYGKKI